MMRARSIVAGLLLAAGLLGYCWLAWVKRDPLAGAGCVVIGVGLCELIRPSADAVAQHKARADREAGY